MQKKLLLFGAGKIGRAFIAQIFSRNGYHVIFIDINTAVVQRINEKKRYTVTTLHPDGSKEDFTVENVHAIDAKNRNEVMQSLLQANLVITSVGANAIPAVCKIIAEAAELRMQANMKPLDIILAENMRNAASTVRGYLTSIPSQAMPGIIEASVGKTAPNLEDIQDPLHVYGDSFNTLIVSNKEWHHKPPQFPQLQLVDNITAYVDRKLLIHNLAHCAIAYFGYQHSPNTVYIHEAMQNTHIMQDVHTLLQNSAEALAHEYAETFTIEALHTYIRKTLDRIANPSLQDTVWRIGRDIPRKLGRSERIIASALLCMKYNISIETHAKLYCSALSFHTRDPHGNSDPIDKKFLDTVSKQGVLYVISHVSHLTYSHREEHTFIKKIQKCMQRQVKKGDNNE